MNKKLHITVVVLFLVFIVFSFFTFFRSEESSIDIVNNGSVNNNVEIINPMKLKVIKPEQSEYNVSVMLPNTFFYKKYDFQVKVIGSGTLNFYLNNQTRESNGEEDYYEKYRYDGVLLSAYKDFTINNVNVTPEELDVDRGNPEVYSMNVNDGEIVNISVKIRYISSSSDRCSFFFVCLFILFLLFMATKKTINNFFENVVLYYNKIDPIYKKALWIIFIVVNIVFLFHTVNFMWGNHEWEYVFQQLKVDSDLCLGRYGSQLFKTLLFGGIYMPVFSNLFSFFFLTLTYVLLGIYWKIPKKLGLIVLAGMFFCLQPFVLEWLYYVGALPELFIAPLAVVSALIISEKYSDIKGSKIRFILWNLISIVLLNYAISVYPSVLNTIFVVLFGKIFIETLNFENVKTEIKKLNKFIPVFFDILIAAVFYKFVLFYLAKKGILYTGMYTIKSISLNDLPLRLIECISSSFEQLAFYQFKFMPNSLTILCSVMFIILLSLIINNTSKISVKILHLTEIFIILFATKITALLADYMAFFVPRIDFFGLLFFRVLVLIVIFKILKDNSLKNVVVILASVVIFISIVNDMDALRVWKLGFAKEKMMWNRIITRIEEQTNFDSNKKYDVIAIGKVPSIRSEILSNDNYNKFSKIMISDAYSARNYDADWEPFIAENFYYPKVFVKNHFCTAYEAYYGNIAFLNDIKKLKLSGIIDKLEVWPSKNSIFVYDDIIIFVADENSLKKFKKYVSEQ